MNTNETNDPRVVSAQERLDQVRAMGATLARRHYDELHGFEWRLVEKAREMQGTIVDLYGETAGRAFDDGYNNRPRPGKGNDGA